MRMHTHGHQTKVTKISKTMNLWGYFVYNTVTYWLAILFIDITLTGFLKRVKGTNETITLLTHFTYIST